jgi:hypothetical protein
VRSAKAKRKKEDAVRMKAEVDDLYYSVAIFFTSSIPNDVF